MFDDSIKTSYCGNEIYNLSETDLNIINDQFIFDTQSIAYIDFENDLPESNQTFYINSDINLSILTDVLFKLLLENNNINYESEILNHKYTFIIVMNRYDLTMPHEYQDYIRNYYKYVDEVKNNDHDVFYRRDLTRKFFAKIPNIHDNYQLTLPTIYDLMNNINIIIYDPITKYSFEIQRIGKLIS